MIEPVVLVYLGGLDDQLERLQTMNDRFNEVLAREVIPASQQRTDDTLNVEPGAHIRPTIWQSERQRRWWFAVGRFLWNGRTGAVRTWAILLRVLSDSEGQIVATNNTDYWQYVFGPQQQKMHMGTWLALDTYQSIEEPQLVSDVQAAWLEANLP